MTTGALDESKLNAFMGKAVGDMGAALHATLVVVGDKLGLYKAMAGAGWMTSGELAEKTRTAERYVREWLNANAASGYVVYDPATRKYELPPEQAFALTVQDLSGAFHIISSCFKDEPKITQAFRTGEGVGWHEHDANLFFGTERFSGPITRTTCCRPGFRRWRESARNFGRGPWSPTWGVATERRRY